MSSQRLGRRGNKNTDDRGQGSGRDRDSQVVLEDQGAFQEPTKMEHTEKLLSHLENIHVCVKPAMQEIQAVCRAFYFHVHRHTRTNSHIPTHPALTDTHTHQ